MPTENQLVEQKEKEVSRSSQACNVERSVLLDPGVFVQIGRHAARSARRTAVSSPWL
jgi:hypothetical protein